MGDIDSEGEDLGEIGEVSVVSGPHLRRADLRPGDLPHHRGIRAVRLRLLHRAHGAPGDFEARADYTSELAETNPDWKLDLNDEVIGRWRGEQGKSADMTLVWGVPLMAGGAMVTAELANLAVDQCELVEERFTLVAPDDYRADFLEVKLWSKGGDELAAESLYVEDDEAEEEDGGVSPPDDLEGVGGGLRVRPSVAGDEHQPVAAGRQRTAGESDCRPSEAMAADRPEGPNGDSPLQRRATQRHAQSRQPVHGR